MSALVRGWDGEGSRGWDEVRGSGRRVVSASGLFCVEIRVVQDKTSVELVRRSVRYGVSGTFWRPVEMMDGLRVARATGLERDRAKARARDVRDRKNRGFVSLSVPVPRFLATRVSMTS